VTPNIGREAGEQKREQVPVLRGDNMALVIIWCLSKYAENCGTCASFHKKTSI